MTMNDKPASIRIGRCATHPDKHFRFIAPAVIIEEWIVDKYGERWRGTDIVDRDVDYHPNHRDRDWTCEECGGEVVFVRVIECPHCSYIIDEDNWGPGPSHSPSCKMYHRCHAKNVTRASTMLETTRTLHPLADDDALVVSLLSDILHATDMINIPFEELVMRARRVYDREVKSPSIDDPAEQDI